jgi:biopolymer transport protein ExbD
VSQPGTHAFRKRNAQALYDMHYGPNMTPMVDVVMVILIFFMASAAMLGPEWFVAARLPKAGGVAATPDLAPTRVLVRMVSGGGGGGGGGGGSVTISVNGGVGMALPAPGTRDSVRALDAVRGAIEAAASGTRENVVVLVEPDAKTPYEWVVRVHALCEQMGFAKVGLGGDGTEAGSAGGAGGAGEKRDDSPGAATKAPEDAAGPGGP